MKLAPQTVLLFKDKDGFASAMAKGLDANPSSGLNKLYVRPSVNVNFLSIPRFILFLLRLTLPSTEKIHSSCRWTATE